MSTSKSPTLELFERLDRFPLGKQLFAKGVCVRAPYFSTIRPRVLDVRSGRVEAAMSNRRAVQNHLGTVHAIAMCNLCEFTGGLAIEVSRPAEVRWIPRGMDVQYLKKAKTDLTAISEIEGIDWSVEQDVPVVVHVYDTDGNEVVRADIRMKASPTRG